MVGALPLVVWLPKLAANGARPGLRAQPGKLSSVFNHHSVYILTVEPLTGQRHQARAEGLGFIWQASDKSTTLQCFPRSVIQVEKKDLTPQYMTLEEEKNFVKKTHTTSRWALQDTVFTGLT